MIAEVRAELLRRMAAHDDGGAFGPVFGAPPRWNTLLEVPSYPYTWLEVFGAPDPSGAWHDIEYGARVVTVMLPITQDGQDPNLDPGDPVLTHQLEALPGTANGVTATWDTEFGSDTASLEELVEFYAPPGLKGEVLAITSSYLVVEADGRSG